MAEKEIDTSATEYPTCPHCGFADQDWWDSQEARSNMNEWDTTCGDCGNEFHIFVEYSARFWTNPSPVVDESRDPTFDEATDS